MSDFRVSNFDLASGARFRGCFAARDQHRSQLVGFLGKRRNLFRFEQLGFDNHVEPKESFVGFFFHDGGLVDEVGARFRSAEGAIIRRYRGSASASFRIRREKLCVLFFISASVMVSFVNRESKT